MSECATSLKYYQDEVNQILFKYFSKHAAFFCNDADGNDYIVSQLIEADHRYRPDSTLTKNQYRVYFLRFKIKEFWRRRKFKHEKLGEISVPNFVDEIIKNEEYAILKPKLKEYTNYLPELNKKLINELEHYYLPEIAKRWGKTYSQIDRKSVV